MDHNSNNGNMDEINEFIDNYSIESFQRYNFIKGFPLQIFPHVRPMAVWGFGSEKIEGFEKVIVYIYIYMCICVPHIYVPHIFAYIYIYI